MRVVVPYVAGMLDEATAAAVAGSGFPVELRQLDRGDLGAYGRLVRGLWREGQTFAIVEQDVIPTRDQLVELAECPGDWCSFLYDTALYPDGPYFGLVKFSARAMRAHPHAAECALVIGKRRDTEAPWWCVDSNMARDLSIRRLRWCLHDGRVRHAHVGPVSAPMEVP